MECNRDEAIRAREIAERKYAVHDFAGAKKFVLKAHQLFPDLDGISQMLAVLDVHHVAQNKLSSNNEMDWYGILQECPQVEPIAAQSTIKQQYRKLALLLHPDKNKAMGAEAAFKLVSEAFGVLSDKEKRAAHDKQQGLKAKVSQAHTHVSQAKAQGAQTGGTWATTRGVPPPPPPHPSLTFWTACPDCRMQYQYLRIYLNLQLRCQKCNKTFEGKEMQTVPQRRNNSSQQQSTTLNDFSGKGWAAPVPPHSQQQDHNTSVNTKGNLAKGNGFADDGLQPGHSSSATPSGTVPTSKVAGAVNVIEETFLKVKRRRVAAEKEAQRKEKEKETGKRELLQQEKQRQVKLKAQEALTFWTACPDCCAQYEYLQFYLNLQLQCQRCKKTFEAKEMQTVPQRTNNSSRQQSTTLHDFSAKAQAAPIPPPRQQQDHNCSVKTIGNLEKGNGFADGRLQPEHCSSATPLGTVLSSKVAGPASVVEQTFLKVKRRRVEAEKEAQRKEKEKDTEKRELLKQQKQRQVKLKAQEALERMKMKQREAADKEARQKAAEIYGNRSHPQNHKRKDDKGQDKDQEKEDLEDSTVSPDGTISFKARLPSQFSGPRRLLCNHRSAMYNINDIDSEELPRAKRFTLKAPAKDTMKTPGAPPEN
jgi:curved DNA-binding protein CbpA